MIVDDDEVSWTAMTSTHAVTSSKAAAPTTASSTGTGVGHSDSTFDRFDDGVMESRDDYIQIRTADHVAHVVNNELNELQVLSESLFNDSGNTLILNLKSFYYVLYT